MLEGIFDAEKGLEIYIRRNSFRIFGEEYHTGGIQTRRFLFLRSYLAKIEQVLAMTLNPPNTCMIQNHIVKGFRRGGPVSVLSGKRRGDQGAPLLK
jgi:hypothetical protein